MSTNESSSPQTDGPGSSRVSVPGIVGILIYLAAVAALLLYTLIVVWPVPPPAKPAAPVESATPSSTIQEDQSPGVSEVRFLGMSSKISDEQRLFILIIAAGGLGSLVHALRSAYWYVGNRNLVLSWIPKYLLLPFCGSTLAVLFYLIVRGGFFSPRATLSETSPFGFCALACMVGLFSEQAVLKLKQVAEMVFMTAEQGKDADPPAGQAKPKENP